jgi:hypothetical protein
MNTNFMSTMKTSLQSHIHPSLQGRGWGLGLCLLCLLFITACSKEDNPSPQKISEKDLIGLWWDEYEYADVTETGEPFFRVLLAVQSNEDHTGCIYLGVFDNNSD